MNEQPQLDACQATETPQSTDITSADQIDVLCDAFEGAWLRGESPQIEAYLDQCDESGRGPLLTELLLVDRELRIRRGETASRLDYRQRFPQYSTVIDQLDFTTIDDRGRRRSGAVNRSATPLSGTKLAHFELLEELGSGASGTVWKAKDSRLRRTVAIKLPRYGSFTDNERERFLREGRAAAQLQHPGIVAVYEVGEQRGQAFIVAEFVEGLNLRDWLKQRQLKSHEAAKLTAQLAEALHHAHEHGVIHRDLKPANVLIDGKGLPHITDFGLAKWCAGSKGITIEGNVVGTPAYMSPEQACGDANKVDGRTDVYALGAVLYELLTGKPPFEGDVAAVVHQVIHHEPPTPRRIKPGLPRDLETICLKAMDKTISRRYASTNEMQRDLRRHLNGEPVAAKRPILVDRIWRHCRRRPAATMLAIVLAFTIAAAAFGLAALTSDKRQLEHEKRRLEGSQLVEIVTEPPGARIALTPLDPFTGTPVTDPKRVVRPLGLTPVRFYVRPDEYFIEATLESDGQIAGVAEVVRIVPAPGNMSVATKQLHWKMGGDQEPIVPSPIKIVPLKESREGMVLLEFDPVIRDCFPNVPDALFVDIKQTPPGSFVDADDRIVDCITYDAAVARLERIGKRLPTAEELRAITEQVAIRRLNGSGAPLVDDLWDAFPEWTSTRFAEVATTPGFLNLFKDLFILEGFAEDQLPPNYAMSGDLAELLQPRAGVPMPTAYRGVSVVRPRFVDF